jgi:hypothetical protein
MLNETAGKKRFAKCDPTWLQMDLTGRELRVLIALSLHADWRPNGLGRCFPKRDTLALTTRLQISHISEAVKTLSDDDHRLITVVRLGRKNIYYVRPVGETAPMPPSNAERFFKYLAEHGYFLGFANQNLKELGYLNGSKNLGNDPLLLSMLSDYANGLTRDKLVQAVVANMTIALSSGKVNSRDTSAAFQSLDQIEDQRMVHA